VSAPSAASPMATIGCVFCGTLNRVDLGRLEHHPKCGECARPILLDRPVKVTDEDFDRVISGTEVPVIVDFYADWCGPCKIMAPVFDELAHELQGRTLVLKMDTDRNPLTPRRFAIRGIPTLIVLRGGKEIGRQIGAVPKAALVDLLAKAG